MNFGKLQLSDEFKRSLSSAVDKDAFSHAALFTGGTVKERKDAAILTAQALFCGEKGEKPCLKCVSCKKVKAGIHPDVTVVSGEPGKPRSIKIDTIRDIRNKAYILPNEAPFQIFIILEASCMGEESQNALLKILEEPPETARFILAARSRDDLRQTILSRVSEFQLNDESGQAAGEKENQKAAAAGRKILEAAAERNEFKIILGTAPLEKDRKAFKAAAETMALTLRNALISNYKADAVTDELTGRLSKAFTPGEILKMQNLLKTLYSDADKNANENLLITRLSTGLAECLSEKPSGK